MSNLIIGTAGHVDHGKTSLINALTGINTDRLIEEKKRGITIELGFAYLNLPNGEKVGIIDVPGHEKFIKNMLAGAGGIDLALLVVAADEGFMPQTREHLDILKLLDIKKGLIVITKCDMVDREWLDEIYADIHENTKNSFLEHAEIVETSAFTMQGIDTLRQKLIEIISATPKKAFSKSFRLPVDRVFSVQGFGTVVTGTLIEGEIEENASIEIFPGKLEARVRTIQVHGQTVPKATAGQRVAVNIAGIKKEQLSRGFVLASPNTLTDTFMVDVKIHMVASTTRAIHNSDTVHFHHGSNEMLGKVVLLGTDEIKAGDTAFAQIRLAEPIALKSQDHFVLRFYSPLETIGGGIVIRPSVKKLKRNQESVHQLELLENGTLAEQIIHQINNSTQKVLSLAELSKTLAQTEDAIKQEIMPLVEENEVFATEDGFVFTHQTLAFYAQKLEELLQVYHAQNKLLLGMPKHDARLQLFGKMKNALSLTLMDGVLNTGQIAQSGELLHLPSFKPQYTLRQKQLKEELQKIYTTSGIEAPLVSELLQKFPKDKEDIQKLISALIFENTLIQISGDFMLLSSIYDSIFTKARDKWGKDAKFTLAEFRDLMQTSRKFALLIMDYWDAKKITKKIDDYRIWLI